jgi:hypothetical protein
MRVTHPASVGKSPPLKFIEHVLLRPGSAVNTKRVGSPCFFNNCLADYLNFLFAGTGQTGKNDFMGIPWILPVVLSGSFLFVVHRILECYLCNGGSKLIDSKHPYSRSVRVFTCILDNYLPSMKKPIFSFTRYRSIYGSFPLEL